MNNKLLKTILVVSLYFCWFTLFEAPFNIFEIKLSNNMMNLYTFISTFLFLVILFLLYKKDFFKEFKKINKELIKSIIKNVLMILIIMVLSNAITLSILKDKVILNVNDNSLNIVANKSLLLIVNILILMPIIEEIVFRKSVRQVIKNNIFFIIFSGIFLSSLYIILQDISIYGFISSLPYILTSVYLSYSYIKKENIYNTIFSKILYNLIILSLWWL